MRRFFAHTVYKIKK